MRRLPLLTLFLLPAASPALAQNGSTAGVLELYPTFHAVGARLAYTGDANGNATARLEWRLAGSGTWIPGVAMTRITNARWAGSVLWLQKDTSYEVRAVITDPDGGTSATGTTRTRLEPSATPTGRAWWVATNGNDANSGDPGSPLATLNAAAGRAQPGDEIRVKPGIYYQTLDTPRSGTAGAYIHLVADGPGVIIDGSDPAYLNRTDWLPHGGGIYSVPYTPTSNRLVVADSLQRLYKQANLAALQSNANGMTQGFAIEAGRLYVKLEDQSSPIGHTMHVARYNVGLYIDSSYWRVAGLEVRHFGTASGGSGIRVETGSNSWIHDNNVHSLGGRGIFLRLMSANNLIERNFVWDPRVGIWPWTATKAHDEEITGISNRAGRGNVHRSNTVRGFFDGMDANEGTSNENIAADADYYENVVTGCGDDAIETDVVSGINLRLWRNVYDDNFSGISIAPIYQGPEYVLYNTVTNYDRSAFKFSLTSTGHAWICHNTTYTSVAGKPAVHPSGDYSYMHFRNNILWGQGTMVVNDETGESQVGNSYDGDLLHTTSSTLFLWKSVAYANLSALRSGTGFEMSGRVGNPQFVSAGAGNFMLLSGSPAIDGALRLTGINDVFSGVGPDMGAFEFGGPDVIPPAAINDLQ